MPSPFPGMNPYLEQDDVWEDFHGRLIYVIAEQLGRHVGPHYIVKIELWLPEVDAFREHHVEIRDLRNRRLVTAIEVLSPTNKTPGANRELYLGKRHELLASTTHFVEIDLRRGGERPPLKDLPDCDYYVMVSRARDCPRLGGWPIHLRDPLPTIRVPLADPDESVRLDLQAALQQVYDAANYGNYIYQSQPQPPLQADDAAWASEVVKVKTL